MTQFCTTVLNKYLAKIVHSVVLNTACWLCNHVSHLYIDSFLLWRVELAFKKKKYSVISVDDQAILLTPTHLL